MSKFIEIQDLIFAYTDESGMAKCNAIDNVSFTVEKGSFLAVIGKNGSGKSTLAKNINALLLPTSGTVLVGGFSTKDEDHTWDIRQRAGMVFQNPDNQIVSAIVEDDVAFGPENLGIEPEVIRKRVDRALENVNMGAYKKKAPHLLSGGQKQRIAIAGAVAMRPECIIFDEPTAMLDPSGRREVLDIIEELHKDGITIILITHFMEEAARAERIIVMDDGKIEMDGSPKDIFEDTEKIRALSLDVPPATELAGRLRAKGIDMGEIVVDEDDLIDRLTGSGK